VAKPDVRLLHLHRSAKRLPFFKGTCTRGIYDNMKAAMETVFVGKERQQFNRRFLQMCSHYLSRGTLQPR
jgi:hypothetical protein